MSAVRSLLGLLLLNLPARLLRFLMEWRRSSKRVIVRLRLAGELVEEQGGRGAGLIRQGRIHLPSLLGLLRQASQDPSVEAVALYLGTLRAGWAQLEEVREAIALLQERGRTVHVYVERPGHAEYFLACACDRIATSPLTSLGVVGLRSEVTFFKGALDLLGVQAHFEAAGEYKSFGEPFTRESMSEAYRESLDFVLRALHGSFVAAVAEGRGLEAQVVQRLIDDGPWSADEALDAGLVDEVVYPDRWKRALRQRLGDAPRRGAAGRRDAAPDLEAGDRGVDAPAPAGKKRLRSRSAVSWLRPWTWLDRLDRWGRPSDLVAVVVASGSIIDSDAAHAPRGRIAARPLSALLTAVRNDRRVKAVVLRVDSPGGSGLASDLLWRDLRRLRKKKPLIASMGSTAASGGYYLSMAADRIFADAGTITGSIGVVAGKINLSGLFERLGIHHEVVSYGDNAGFYSTSGDFSDSERARLRARMADFYRIFVGKAAQCRELGEDDLEQHARGRVWTGRQALQRGLVDGLGGFHDAVSVASGLAGHDSPLVAVTLQAADAPWWSPLRWMTSLRLASRFPTLSWLAQPELRRGGLLARLPFDFRIG